MTKKTDFSNAEWEILRDAPHLVILSVTLADDSGFFGTIAEALAPSGPMSEALTGDNQLLRELCEKEEIKSSITSIKSRAKASGDFSLIQTGLRREAIDTSRAALDLLSKKGTHQDVVAYREFLITLGERVALAAKEGDILGFGGERISEHERTFLAELAKAVGALQA